MECQSHYFDCDYDDVSSCDSHGMADSTSIIYRIPFEILQNEHQKTDGGLGAGTPMFISEVMHGSGCNIL